MKSAFLVLLFLATTNAFPQFVSQFPNGNAASLDDSGITCPHLGHNDCVPGAPRNPFGQDWDENDQKWSKELCEKDSDGDGLTNGEELGDPCCEWTLENPTPLRKKQLSHPGDAGETGAASAPKCQTSGPGSVAPPVTTASTTTPTTTGTTAPPATTAATTAATTTAATTAATTTGGTTAATTTGATTAATTTGATTAATTTAATTTTTEDSAVTPTPSPSPTDDDAVCFPAHAQVQLESGHTKSMADLRVGDRVQVGRGAYSDVFLFTHKISDVSHQFVVIRTGTAEKLDAQITLTSGHYIYANGGLITAGSVKTGDTLELHDGRMSRVVDVECASFKGLYNPQTTHGDLIVDGVKVSTYTTAVETGVAHSLLAPLRAVYRWFGWSPLSLDEGASRVAKMLP